MADSAELVLVTKILSRYQPTADSLIPILHEVQQNLRQLPDNVTQAIADYLKVPVSKVYGVATFYSLFSTIPKGKYIIRVCGSAPCYILGTTNLLKAIEKELGIKPGETSADFKFTLEHTSCLGVCGVAPAIMINDEVYGNLTEEKLSAVLKKL